MLKLLPAFSLLGNFMLKRDPSLFHLSKPESETIKFLAVAPKAFDAFSACVIFLDNEFLRILPKILEDLKHPQPIKNVFFFLIWKIYNGFPLSSQFPEEFCILQSALKDVNFERNIFKKTCKEGAAFVLIKFSFANCWIHVHGFNEQFNTNPSLKSQLL